MGIESRLLYSTWNYMYCISSNWGLSFYFLLENFESASKWWRLVFEAGLYLPMSALTCLNFWINFNHTYSHLVTSQRVDNNLTMEIIILSHHSSKAFWMSVIGEELSRLICTTVKKFRGQGGVGCERGWGEPIYQHCYKENISWRQCLQVIHSITTSITSWVILPHITHVVTS